MTRRLLLVKWTPRPVLKWRWLAFLMIVVSIVTPLWFFPHQIQAQSGITSPAGGGAFSGDVPVIGTAGIDPFQRDELYYK